MATLSQDIAAYERMRDKLESEHHGRWAVVHDEELIDTYGSFETAADDAVRRFGRGPYLMKLAAGRPSCRRLSSTGH